MIPFLEFLLLRIALPLAMDLIRKRDLDPTFKKLSDDLFMDWDNAKTTEDKKSVVRKLHELQKL